VPFLDVPLNVTEEALWGSLDLEETLKAGWNIREKGLLERADGGILYVDDLNLLSTEITALLFKAQGLRKGDARFSVLASMNPEEGELSPHFLDRFGMCVVWEGLKDPAQRVAVMKQAGSSCSGNGGLASPGQGPDRDLRQKIAAARQIVDEVEVPPDLRGYITTQCIENLIAGHRGDVFFFYAARACAAFCGEKEVTREHVEKVLPLVLTHRRRLLQNPESDPQEEPQRQEPPPEHQDKQDNDLQTSEDSMPDREDSTDGNASDGPDRKGERPRESRPQEDIFASGQTFKVQRLTFRKDRQNRSISGRRTKTGSTGKRGRYVKSLLRPNGDIAVDATLRAAAPYQTARGRKHQLLIHDADLRFKQREKKMGHLVIFVVDGSGSMGARQRMVETKGAVQSLLVDCYQKRERVSMIVFRKDRAEIVLPPTSSVETASGSLRDVPVGGKTPLSAGLLETWRLIRRTAARTPQTRFLVALVTDGRANQGLSETPIQEELQKMTALLRDLNFTDFIVIDTEEKGKFMKTDRAQQIASSLNADYYTIDGLKADYLTEIVRRKNPPTCRDVHR
jgi:magnesium chelatase subunit D